MSRLRLIVVVALSAVLLAAGAAVAIAAPDDDRGCELKLLSRGLGETGMSLRTSVAAPDCGEVRGTLYRRDASGNGAWKSVDVKTHQPGSQRGIRYPSIVFNFENFEVCGDYYATFSAPHARFTSREASARTPVLDRKPSDCSD